MSLTVVLDRCGGLPRILNLNHKPAVVEWKRCRPITRSWMRRGTGITPGFIQITGNNSALTSRRRLGVARMASSDWRIWG